MKVSRAQVVSLKSTLWPAACRAQQWPEKDRDFQMAWLSQCVGREIKTSNDLERKGEFDKVKRDLELAASNLDAASRAVSAEQGHDVEAQERVRHQLDEVMQCLALYVADVPAYAREIIRDKILRGARHTRVPEMDELSTAPRFFTRKSDGQVVELPSQLEQMLYTLSRALNGKKGYRNQAGDSLCTMRIKAGLRCACARCSKLAAQGWRYDREFKLVPLEGESREGATEAKAEELVAAGVEGEEPF